SERYRTHPGSQCMCGNNCPPSKGSRLLEARAFNVIGPFAHPRTIYSYHIFPKSRAKKRVPLLTRKTEIVRPARAYKQNAMVEYKSTMTRSPKLTFNTTTTSP
ncbi:unnamed protein product, partial [Ectocarpus sp. 6 AP-2014]